jgi:hypothetical protein
MKMKSLLPFNAFGYIVGEAGKEFEVENEKVALDLMQAKFAEQVDSKPTTKPRNARK